MLRMLWRLAVAALAVAGLLFLATAAWFIRGGVGAKPTPGRVETAVARRLRAMAIPRNARNLPNPVQATPDVQKSGMAHFADHCAICHANDGSGETEIGRGLYPRAPDMRQEPTQSLSDGELFYIIENGVRLTGMPAWSTGTTEGEEASWHLVHFVRHLSRLTPEELEEMESLNPKAPAEIRQEIEAEQFLEGGSEQPPTKPATQHKHPGGHE